MTQKKPIVKSKNTKPKKLTPKVDRPQPDLPIIHILTELTQAGQALRKSEERYRILFERASDGILYLSANLEVLEVNEAFARMHGYSLEEMRNIELQKLETPETTRAGQERLRRIVDGEAIKFVAEHYHKDGHTFPLEVTSSLISVGGEVLIQAFHRDITERNQAEKLQDAIYRLAQAADQTDKLDSLYPSIHAIIQEVMAADNFYIALIDEKNNLLSFPYSCDEMDPPAVPKLPGKGLTEYVLRTGRSLLCDQALFEDLRQRGEVGLVGEASPIWLGVPLMIADKAIGIMAVQDYKNVRAYGEREQRILEFVSSQAAMAIQRKRVEEDLHQSEDKFKYVFDHSVAGKSFTLPSGELNVNQAFCEMLGYSAEELMHRKWQEITHPDDVESTLNVNNALLSGEQESMRFTKRFIHKDGSIVWADVATALRREKDGKPLYFMTTFLDITERKQAEEEIRQLNTNLELRVEARTRELREAQEQLVRQEKLAVLGQLAGGVGHELRTPLSIINNAVYYLKLVQPDADDKVRKHLALIEQEVHIADKIITDLLDFARTKSVDRQPVSVPELVQRVLIRFPVPDSVTAALKLPSSLPVVFADLRQMEQVLGNLTVNACQAMPKGGRLTISARRVKELVAIAVKDTGVGIPPENIEKLFEPLFTTRIGGIGLGLVVSRKLAEANGGRIEVQSDFGKGSTFTLYLPVSS
jgi:PAS domain S-box-containing protein